jgi:hypothetical protein
MLAQGDGPGDRAIQSNPKAPEPRLPSTLAGRAHFCGSDQLAVGALVSDGRPGAIETGKCRDPCAAGSVALNGQLLFGAAVDPPIGAEC